MEYSKPKVIIDLEEYNDSIHFDKATYERRLDYNNQDRIESISKDLANKGIAIEKDKKRDIYVLTSIKK